MKRVNKIGQLLMAGFHGGAPSKEIQELIKKHHIGGVVLFSRNIKDPAQCAKLTESLQKLAPDAPLLIAVDQEGGKVSRLAPPFTQFPSARALGQCDSVTLTYSCAEAMAKEMLAVGINMNFAPVLDVDTNPSNPVIGDRSFGKSPTLVSKHGLAMIVGMQDQKVIACGKHYPGHGDTDADSHKILPRVDHSADRLTDVELRPFMHTIDNRLSCVMTAHVLYSHLDDKNPASLSKKIIGGLLRKTLHFDGVVVTDDLEMKAIAENYPAPEAAVKAIQAGSDLILVCHSPDQQLAVMEALTHAVEKKVISEERLNESLNRLLRLKENFLLPHHPPHPKQVKEVVGCEAHRTLVEEVLKKSETTSVKKA
ncbi:MAG TPA: beta-N-acetylhexosaminidase [Candidatus Manganitrophaceae bacterium]|nr:beta-N-acetylhexosaminidase [Candidatus Manganitrophaceae bacterium]